jgi:acyl-CoA dehydrogenase
MTHSSVSAEDFADIIDQLRHFIRTVVVPREREIAEGDRVPDDLRIAAKELGLFGYAIPQEWGRIGT